MLGGAVGAGEADRRSFSREGFVPPDPSGGGGGPATAPVVLSDRCQRPERVMIDSGDPVVAGYSLSGLGLSRLDFADSHRIT